MIWIGTGQATMTVVPKIVAAGKRVAIVEGGAFGGTCVNTGCTPTKTLVASARALHLARRGQEFGFSVGRLDVDFAAVMKPQQVNRRAASAGIKARLRELTGGAVFRGFASFLSDHEVEVDGRRLEGDTIVIHVGTRPNVANVPGIDAIPWLNNESILDLDVLPEHLIVVGGSYIALEFGQMFRRLGSRVTVLERGPRLVSREDEDISELVAERFRDEGIDLRFDTRVEAVSPDQGVTVRCSDATGESLLHGSHILFAIGRTPNSDRLALDNSGIETDTRGYIAVNARMQTSVPHIYALGDVNGRGAFTHTSVHDGEIFWDHYGRSIGANTGPVEWDRTIDDRAPVYSMFIDPPLARVGMDETQARRSGRRVLMATMKMSEIGRAREMRETHGLVKVLVDAESGRVLGATVFGTGGDEVIATFATLMQTGAPFQVLRRVVLPHPTIAELMPWVLDRLQPLQP